MLLLEAEAKMLLLTAVKRGLKKRGKSAKYYSSLEIFTMKKIAVILLVMTLELRGSKVKLA